MRHISVAVTLLKQNIYISTSKKVLLERVKKILNMHNSIHRYTTRKYLRVIFPSENSAAQNNVAVIVSNA